MNNMQKDKERLIIYQVFPRILGNANDCCVPFGTYEQNGSGKMSAFTPTLLNSIKSLGANAIWYTGIIEHATKTVFPGITPDNPYIVKGEAGSPYAIKDYYDIDPAIADVTDNRMAEFEQLVKRTHDAGLKVIIDFVPNHTARCYHSDAAPAGVSDFGANDDTNASFRPSNNYYYITNQLFCPSIPLGNGDSAYREFPAKATGNDCFNAFCSEYDWYETAKLNYGHDYGNGSDHFAPYPDTWLKMRDILEFWASRGVDGFRCDMVFMVPQPFWHWVITEVKKKYPNLIFIGEIYDVALYRSFLDYCGFDYLYDKVNLYDTLVGIERHNYSAARLTGCWQTVDGIGSSMLNFLENHDEVRYASKSFAGDPAKVTPALVVSSMMSTGAYMLYYGQELGENAIDNEGFAGDNDRSTIFDYWSYKTMNAWNNCGKWDEELLTPQQRWLRNRYSLIQNLCNSEKALRSGAFFDLMYVNLDNPELDPHSIYTFVRYDEQDVLLIVANFSEHARTVGINIPDALLAVLPNKGKGLTGTNLLSGEKTSLDLTADAHTIVSVGGNDAAVIKITQTDDK